LTLRAHLKLETHNADGGLFKMWRVRKIKWNRTEPGEFCNTDSSSFINVFPLR
jgi:hypothetical protein